MEALKQLFIRLVRIASESGNEEEVLRELERIFTQELGATCQFDSYGNLIARLEARNSDKEEPVLLGAHADTVKPGTGIVPVVTEGVITSEGDTILGADDKAGIAEIVEALRTAKRHPPIEVLITRCEEVGLLGAKNLDMSLIRAKLGFILDTSEPNAILVGGPTHISLDIEIEGKSAHAGLRPEQGISAIRTAAIAILSLREGRVDSETTANIGMIEGGQARNSVSGTARVAAECRSLCHESALETCATMERAFRDAARETGAKVSVTRTVEYEAARIEPDRPVVVAARRAISRAGLTPDIRVSAGGSDAIVLTAMGIETVVLGFGGKKAHSLEESIALVDMQCAVNILLRLLEILA